MRRLALDDPPPRARRCRSRSTVSTISPFLRSALIGPSVQPARAASCFAVSGRGLAASSRSTSACLAESFNSAIRAAAAGRHGQQRHVARARLMPHAGRHDRLQHLAPRAQIIVRHPLRQPQHRRRDERLPIEHLATAFSFRPPVGLCPSATQYPTTLRLPRPSGTRTRRPTSNMATRLRRDSRRPPSTPPARGSRTRRLAHSTARPSPRTAAPHHPVPTAAARYRRVIAGLAR